MELDVFLKYAHSVDYIFIQVCATIILIIKLVSNSLTHERSEAASIDEISSLHFSKYVRNPSILPHLHSIVKHKHGIKFIEIICITIGSNLYKTPCLWS